MAWTLPLRLGRVIAKALPADRARIYEVVGDDGRGLERAHTEQIFWPFAAAGYRPVRASARGDRFVTAALCAQRRG